MPQVDTGWLRLTQIDSGCFGMIQIDLGWPQFAKMEIRRILAHSDEVQFKGDSVEIVNYSLI